MAKRRMTTVGLFLLVLALIVVGLAGCARSAQEREAPATEAAGTVVSGGAPSGEGSAPAPGETVVSAVTPVPGAGDQATPVESSETPAAGQPTTAAPEATAAPTTAPPASQPPTSTGGVIVHTVQRGETTYSIARRYGTTVQAIAQANNMVNPSHIVVGQPLKIPNTTGSSGGTSDGTSGGTSGCRLRHTVQRGEWIWQIARRYGVSPYTLMAANGLTVQTANPIYAGTVLCIP